MSIEHPGDIPTKWPANDMRQAAWGLIANTSSGIWSKQSEEWQAAAKAWAEHYPDGDHPTWLIEAYALIFLTEEPQTQEWTKAASEWLAQCQKELAAPLPAALPHGQRDRHFPLSAGERTERIQVLLTMALDVLCEEVAVAGGVQGMRIATLLYAISDHAEHIARALDAERRRSDV